MNQPMKCHAGVNPHPRWRLISSAHNAASEISSPCWRRVLRYSLPSVVKYFSARNATVRWPREPQHLACCVIESNPTRARVNLTIIEEQQQSRVGFVIFCV